MATVDASKPEPDELSRPVPIDERVRTSWWRRTKDMLVASAVAGVIGGLAVFAIETIERVATLWPSFNSSAEPVVFTLYLAPVIFLGLLAGVVAGPCLAAIRTVALTIERALKRRAGLLAEKLTFVLLAALITLGAGIALRLAMNVLGVRSLRRMSLTLSLYFVDANAPMLARLAEAAANHVFLLFLVGIFLTSLGIVVASQMVADGPLRFSAVVRRVVVAIGAVGLVALYFVDSRFEYARYDTMVHVPAAALQLILAFYVAATVLRLIQTSKVRRAANLFALAVLVLAVISSSFAVIHIGSNENLKALLWRRSIVARRAYQVAVTLSDRDGDGYSSVLAGGDVDDGDPNTNPLATEIPGNGIDDNCIGGDLAVVPPEREHSVESRSANGKRFILIAIDTLRADRMSLYGYGRPTTPQIDEFARSGLVFENAFSAGTNTAVAFSAMQTSAFRAAVFEPGQTRLFPALAKAGYRTGQVNAVAEDLWLRGKHSSVPYRRVILDGIRDYPHDLGEEFWDADKVTDAAIEYLSSVPAGTPSATWIHYFDPHTPRKQMAPFDFGASASDKYDTEVAFADREIGRLMQWMQASGLMKDTIVILMSDHGEAFLEHGTDFHGNRPYSEQINIPIVVWAPGIVPGRTQAPASTVDIAPTVFDFVGLGPMPGASGMNLLASIPADRSIFAETPLNIVDGPFHAFAITQNGWKLIYDVIGNTTELYDLELDPLEIHNRADAEPARAAELRAALAHWLDTTRSVATATEAREILDGE